MAVKHVLDHAGNVIVSYSYFEKDDIQRTNAEFFWKVGMGINSQLQAPSHTEFVVVVQGRLCRSASSPSCDGGNSRSRPYSW